MRKKLFLLIILVVAVMLPSCVNAEETYDFLGNETSSDFITIGNSTYSDNSGTIQFTVTGITKEATDIGMAGAVLLCSDFDNKVCSDADPNLYSDGSIEIIDSEGNNSFLITKNGSYTIKYKGDGTTYNVFTFNVFSAEKYEEIAINLPFGNTNPKMRINKYTIPVEDESDVIVPIPSDNKVTSTMLTDIKNDGRKWTYEHKDGNNILYSWTFDGSKIGDTNYDLNLKLTVGVSENQKKMEKLIPVGKDNPLYLHFDHHGNLPKGTSVKVRVSDKYKNGEKLVLYYYNEQTGKLEEVSKNLEVKDGYVEFGLEHCSDYVLASDDNSNNAQTSSMNTTMYIIISLISLIGGIISVIIIRKKKIA